MFDITSPDYVGKDVDALVAALGARLGEDVLLADIGTQEIGLVLKNGKVEDVLAPGTRKLYWLGCAGGSAAVALTERSRSSRRSRSVCDRSGRSSGSRWR